jgi:hypothetical protein
MMITEFAPSAGLSSASASSASRTSPMDIPEVTTRWIDDEGRELQAVAGVPSAGVLVSLRTRAGREIAQTSTDSAGSYRFEEVPPGDYLVVFTVPSGTRQVAEAGSLSNSVSGPAAQPATGPDAEAVQADRWSDDRAVLTDIQTWTGGPTGFRLVGTLA